MKPLPEYADIGVILVLPGHAPEDLGMLPGMIDQDDPRSAAEQFDANYQHGGGWHPMQGFKRTGGLNLKYPGDPVLSPIALWSLRDEELIVVYQGGIVAVFNIETETFEVARMD